MSGPALEYRYSYPYLSHLDRDADLASLNLATTHTPADQSQFFRGALTQPRLTADLLLALVRVVQSRYHVPPAMLARILAQADPIVTCAEDRLRFEGFSACCGAYARVDLLPDALEGMLLAPGTTNVDFNPPMRAALAALRDSERVRLSVGRSEVALERGGQTVVERKVLLPIRWIKGLLNVQAVQAKLAFRIQVNGTEARRFLRSLPRQGTQGRPAWIVPSGAGAVRLTQVPSRDAVRVCGLERLRVLEEIARHARSLRIYAGDDGNSGWELETPVARFHLVLSPEIWRGFSGEGATLGQLSQPPEAAHLAMVRSVLQWQSHLDPERIGHECELSPAQVERALAHLAAAGVVGYDLSQSGYFHREVPFDLQQIDTLEPRLRDARRLVNEGGVRWSRTDDGGVEAWVRGTGVDHRVLLTTDGSRCTCPWYAKHQAERGPCKHVLATQIVTGPGDGD